ncbi:transcription termination factor NusA [Mesoplasma tabanidae]|uniref:Transcription termination/antitermination protein NusA n=1 Tax=Mesoplasma tabanidae TaxID=219745 RepID=A0A2K8P433_9MOLU|nr:transcription termination factor NusA [Mesoplasma tabanidae]ATZ21512.1 transcription elongation factor NusA [Mesoplasma tabanidae]
MVNGAQILEALASLESEKSISKEVAIEGIKEGFQKAYERFFDTEAVVKTEINEQTGSINLFQELMVVATDDEIEDDWLEIVLEDALKINKEAKVGDKVYKQIDFDEEFSRVAVGQVRQIFQQKIRATERAMIYEKFIQLEGEIVRGKIVGMNDQGTSYILDIDGVHTSLWNQKTINREEFVVNELVDVLLEEVARENKYSQLVVSRVAPKFLAKLVEKEVSEVAQGLVEVMSVSREPGKRAKIAVLSHDEDVEPIGAIVGVKGSRINNISKELRGEKIDVVKWDDEIIPFIINAMAPVKVISVNEVEGEFDIVVPNQQLSLAIGKGGMAAKLVANLLKRRINIYSLENAITDNMDVLWNGNITEEEVNNPDFINEVNKRKINSQTVKPEYHKNSFRNAQANNEEELMSFQAEVEEEYNQVEELIEETNAVVEENKDLESIQSELESFNDILNDEDEEDFEEDEYEDLYDQE